MSDTQWGRADRAAAALQAHGDQVHGQFWDGYGDEGSAEFEQAVMDLLVDLKHLLYRAGLAKLMLTDMADKAVDVWAEECEALPTGGDES
jgi:hypothetical protein